MASPSYLDIWIARELAECLNRYPQFDMAVQSGIRHNVLGGFWYAAALFMIWVHAARQNQTAVRLRMLTVIAGSVITILLTIAAAFVISWPPPIHSPGLAGLFPSFLEASPNTNCFPSQSTAVYGSIAAGIYSLQRTAGWILWVALPFVVSLPRMYVGGHYFSDVVASLGLALAGYACARYLLEPALISRLHAYLAERCQVQYVLDFLIFGWILEVAVEFRDFAWLLRGIKMVLA